MKDVLEEITRLRLKRGWSEYELAKHSGLAQSTISTWYSKGQTPTLESRCLNSLRKVLSQYLLHRDKGKC